ncbi:hypothetical protein AURDEDRAFT_121450 [Auricularia subglabra TFB-10046 SS5]|nr:hypothetical protein AURDEDRAFT_121450 [Auricularia subglabra TFB-10046 SS5]
MPQSWGTLLQGRLLDEERSLADLLTHAEQLEAAYVTARGTYEATARALRELQADKVVVAERLDLLRCSVKNMHARLADDRGSSRPTVQTMPTELLRCVFLLLVRSYEPDTLWDHRGLFNADRARVPFLLSAVSRRFRELARGYPALWTYAGVPSLDVRPRNRKTGHINLLRVKQILSLSKNMPLDVLVPWGLERPWSCGNEWHRRIIDTLSLFAHRFRRVVISFPQKGDLDPPLSMFSRSMPMLEELTITASSNDAGWRPGLKYLEFCPRLRVLRSENSNVVFSSQCAITSLTLVITMPCDQIWELLSLAAPTIEHLDIAVQWLDPGFVVDPPKRSLVFRALKSLVVGHCFARMIGPWAGLISVPTLTDIAFQISDLGLLHRFLEQQCAATLRTLSFSGHGLEVYATDEHAAQLRGLANVETASFSYVVDESFVQALIDGMWPKLKHFALVGMSALTSRESDVLARLVRARNHAPPKVEGDCRTARIEKITMGLGTVEEWVRGEVRYLLGEEQELSDGEPWDGSDDEDGEE